MYRKFVIFERGFYPRSIGARKRFCKSPRAGCQTRGSEQRPEWGAKHQTEAVAEARGHGVLPKRIFKISERTMRILGKSPNKNQKLYIFLCDSTSFSFSQKKKRILWKKTFCQFVYFLPQKHLYIFIAEKKREGSRVASLSPFTLKKYRIPIFISYSSWKKVVLFKCVNIQNQYSQRAV